MHSYVVHAAHADAHLADKTTLRRVIEGDPAVFGVPLPADQVRDLVRAAGREAVDLLADQRIHPDRESVLVVRLDPAFLDLSGDGPGRPRR